MLTAYHNKMDGSKAVVIDRISKDDCVNNLEENLRGLVQRLKDKSYKPKPARKVEIPKDNDKTRLLSIYSYDDYSCVMKSQFRKTGNQVYGT